MSVPLIFLFLSLSISLVGNGETQTVSFRTRRKTRIKWRMRSVKNCSSSFYIRFSLVSSRLPSILPVTLLPLPLATSFPAPRSLSASPLCHPSPCPGFSTPPAWQPLPPIFPAFTIMLPFCPTVPPTASTLGSSGPSIHHPLRVHPVPTPCQPVLTGIRFFLSMEGKHFRGTLRLCESWRTHGRTHRNPCTDVGWNGVFSSVRSWPGGGRKATLHSCHDQIPRQLPPLWGLSPGREQTPPTIGDDRSSILLVSLE